MLLTSSDLSTFSSKHLFILMLCPRKVISVDILLFLKPSSIATFLSAIVSCLLAARIVFEMLILRLDRCSKSLYTLSSNWICYMDFKKEMLSSANLTQGVVQLCE